MKYLNILLISGKIQSGKDTLANHMMVELGELDEKVDTMKFAEPLKQITANLASISRENCERREFKNKEYIRLNDYTLREYQIELSKGFKHVFGEGHFGDLLAREIISRRFIEEAYDETPPNVILVDDWRFATEADTLEMNLRSFYKSRKDDLKIRVYKIRIRTTEDRQKKAHASIAKTWLENKIAEGRKDDDVLHKESLIYADAITTDISETDLDRFEGGTYFDLQLTNGLDTELNQLKLQITHFIKSKIW